MRPDLVRHFLARADDTGEGVSAVYFTKSLPVVVFCPPVALLCLDLP